MNRDLNFSYSTASRSFLVRAMQNIEVFEKERTAANFFYAALELRFGIEARLNEYLSAALRAKNNENIKTSEYVATKLLKRLTELNQNAETEKYLKITSNSTGRSTELIFTPVTKKLAIIHGKLGELLHYKFFYNNEYWYVPEPLGGGGKKSLCDYIELLKEGIEELTYATSGSLLYHSSFQEMVNEELELIEKGV